MFFHLSLPHLGTQTSSPRWTRCTKSVSSSSQRVCRLLTAADGDGTCLRQLTVEKAMLTAEPLTHPTRKLPANERLSIKQNDGFRHYLNWVELVFCNLQPIIRVPNPQEADWCSLWLVRHGATQQEVGGGQAEPATHSPLALTPWKVPGAKRIEDRWPVTSLKQSFTSKRIWGREITLL